MDGPRCYGILLIFALLCLQSRAEIGDSVIFLDSPSHQYLRSHRPDGDAAWPASLSSTEVGAAVSVLLGFAPPATLSAASSSKLNAVLMPNPFDRPQHVLLLEVHLNGDSLVKLYPDHKVFSHAIESEMISGADKVQIELPEGEVGFLSLDGLGTDSSADVADKEIQDFASWLGGSYNGEELTFLLPSGAEMKLDMSKRADLDFTRKLVYLVRSIRSAMEMPDNASGSKPDAELLKGCFNGIKALQEEYGSQGVVEQGTELFLLTTSKLFDLLHSEYRGQVVGVILFGTHSMQGEGMVDVVFPEQPLRRWLEEAKAPNATIIAEVILVRKTIAWATGIVLLIASLMGAYLLMYMPLTRDTLLYANVKLD